MTPLPRYLAILAPALLLGACQAEAPTEAPETPVAAAPEAAAEPGPSTCGAEKLAAYLNILPTDEIKKAIARDVGERTIRYIAPGDLVTQDLRPDRLNVETGEDGRIKQFRCG